MIFGLFDELEHYLLNGWMVNQIPVKFVETALLNGRVNEFLLILSKGWNKIQEISPSIAGSLLVNDKLDVLKSLVSIGWNKVGQIPVSYMEAALSEGKLEEFQLILSNELNKEDQNSASHVGGSLIMVNLTMHLLKRKTLKTLDV